jgi:FkbM family methyltransferase
MPIMTFQSYAQNFEDVMLWRALGHIDGGFYIDVGAQDPVLDSVTCAFYERGWRGINIEPVPRYYEALVAARPEDVNLQAVAVDAPGAVTLYNIPDSGLSTLDPTIAAMHAARGWKVERLIVEQLTLADICRRHAPGDIHFLKVDVEGVERETLAGADWHANRPWIVLVEATLPNSPEENWGPWEPILTGAGYRFVWFDGLNRFYVARERATELERHFRVPPNTFDRFQKVYPGLQRELRVQIAESAALKAKLANAEAEIGRLVAAADAAAATREANRSAPVADAATASHSAPGSSAQDAALKRALRPAWRAARDKARPLARRRKAFMSAETAAGVAALQRSIDEIGRELRELSTTLRDISARHGDPAPASRPGQSNLRKINEPTT